MAPEGAVLVMPVTLWQGGGEQEVSGQACGTPCMGSVPAGMGMLVEHPHFQIPQALPAGS